MNDATDVTVCLAHGRFVPCRKRGPHEYSSRGTDVAMVHYYQHMSAREARFARPEPVYEEDTATGWQDQFVTLTEDYGVPLLKCGGMVLEPLHRNGEQVALVHRPCSATFTGWTPRMLAAEFEAHYTTVKHYRLETAGRKRNAEPGTRKDGSQ